MFIKSEVLSIIVELDEEIRSSIDPLYLMIVVSI